MLVNIPRLISVLYFILRMWNVSRIIYFSFHVFHHIHSESEVYMHFGSIKYIDKYNTPLVDSKYVN